MDTEHFIIAAYAVTGLLILWLIGTTWLRARKVERELMRQKDR